MFESLHHISYTVSDLDRTIPFYRDVLGFRFIHDVERSGLPAYDTLMGHEDPRDGLDGGRPDPRPPGGGDTMKKLTVLAIGGIGYVLGARAGRERYEQSGRKSKVLVKKLK